MTRSVWKGPFVDGYLLKKADAARSSGRHEMIRIWSRRSTILPQFVGLDLRRLQRPEARSGDRHRGNGRAQIRGIRPDARRSTDIHRIAKPSAPRGRVRLRPKAAARRRLLHRRRAHREAGRASMSKKKRERALSDNEAKAVARMLRISPQKLNLLAQLIRGKKVATALADLEFSRKRIARDVRKCLESAIANAENNHDLDVDDLVVAEAHVGKAHCDQAALSRARAAASARFSSRSRISPSWCVRSRRRRKRERRGEHYGSKGQSDRASARHQPHLGFALVCRQGELRLAAA